MDACPGQEAVRAQIPSVFEQTKHSECAPSLGSFLGQKRALLIGISTSSAEGYGELKTAHDDVYKMRDLLLDHYEYTLSEITILVDDGIDGHDQPTRDNILAAIKKFVKDVKKGDQLCFHYSGHSTQIPADPRSMDEEDGMDECLIPLDGLMIVDNELHDTLVRPLPAGSRLVAILDTCNSGSLLDLKHYRCNRVHVPWVWRGRRNSEEIRSGIVRRGARVVTLSQTTGPALHNAPTTLARAPPRRSVISVVCDPPTSSAPSSRSSTGIGNLARVGSGHATEFTRTNSGPLSKASPLARLRTASKTLGRLRTLSLAMSSTGKNKDQEKNKENLTASDVGPALPALSKLTCFFPEAEALCQSPVGQWPCDGWCRNVEGHSTAMEDEVKADVISLASCKDSQRAWEFDGKSMTSFLVEVLKKDPHRSLKEVLVSVSHATYTLALQRHGRSKAHKKERKKYEAKLVQSLQILQRVNRSPTSPMLPEPSPAIAQRPTLPNPPRSRKTAFLQAVDKQILLMRQWLKTVRQDRGYDMDSFQNPELASPRPLDLDQPWRM